MGNVKGIPPGDVQRMSAGRGVMHSEFNHEPNGQTHFLQIWIEPNVTGIAPSYEQKTFAAQAKRGQLKLVAANLGSAHPEDLSAPVHINADARMYAGLFDGAEAAELPLAAGRGAYVHLIRGELSVNGQALKGGDAAMLEGEPGIQVSAGKDAEVLVFDVAMP
jgi:redox-sensitive bicupin YhaK (pirin superfamily)